MAGDPMVPLWSAYGTRMGPPGDPGLRLMRELLAAEAVMFAPAGGGGAKKGEDAAAKAAEAAAIAAAKAAAARGEAGFHVVVPKAVGQHVNVQLPNGNPAQINIGIPNQATTRNLSQLPNEVQVTMLDMQQGLPMIGTMLATKKVPPMMGTIAIIDGSGFALFGGEGLEYEDRAQFKVVPAGPLPDKDWPLGAKREKLPGEQGFEYLYKVGEKVEVVQHVKNHVTIECLDDGHEVGTYDEEFWEAFRTDPGGEANDVHAFPLDAFMSRLSGAAAVARDSIQPGETINDENDCYKIVLTSEISMYDGVVEDVEDWKRNGKGGFGIKGLSQGGKAPTDRFSFPVGDGISGSIVNRVEYGRTSDGKSKGKVKSYDDKTKSSVDHSATWYYSRSGKCPAADKDTPDQNPTYK